MAARHAASHPQLDEVSQHAIQPASDPHVGWDESGFDPDEDEQEAASGDDTADAAETLWFALCVAPAEGIGIAGLMRISGMSRPTLYRYLAQHARAGRAVQVGWGRWRAVTTEEPHGE